MAAVPPPQGLNETDYEAIEAAVTETVRGRWFLNEFARRNRLAETRQLLDAMARIETAVANGPVALPAADPSIRLLIQRVKEIATQLGSVAGDMRAAGVDERFAEAVDGQARAVSAMMRGPAPAPRPALSPHEPEPRPMPARVEVKPQVSMPRMPRAELPAAFAAPPPNSVVAPTPPRPGEDPRLAALSRLDGMSLADKLALFT